MLYVHDVPANGSKTCFGDVKHRNSHVDQSTNIMVGMNRLKCRHIIDLYFSYIHVYESTE